MQGISINVSMHQYFGKYIEVIETRNELFKYSKDGDNWFFRPEWFENDDILYIDKLFDDLFEEI